MAAPTMIVNLLLDTLVTSLTKVLQTDVSPSDLTYADVVKKGLLQENKTLKNIQIGVQGGDHDDPELKDGLRSLARMPDLDIILPTYEIGGGATWMRLGVARVEIFLVREGLTETEAHETAYAVLGRLTKAIEDTKVGRLVDSFGEHAWNHPYVYSDTFSESGGPPNKFIFRGKVRWLVFTERPRN